MSRELCKVAFISKPCHMMCKLCTMCYCFLCVCVHDFTSYESDHKVVMKMLFASNCCLPEKRKYENIDPMKFKCESLHLIPSVACNPQKMLYKLSKKGPPSAAQAQRSHEYLSCAWAWVLTELAHGTMLDWCNLRMSTPVYRWQMWAMMTL